MYNLTAYYSTTKKVHCALRTEAMTGRAGDDIASAFRKILDIVVEENDVSDIVTSSNSCVPQNQNSIVSNAVLYFVMKKADFQSPIGFYKNPLTS